MAAFRIRAAAPADRPVLGRLLMELEALHAELQPAFFAAPPRSAHLPPGHPDQATFVAEPEAGGAEAPADWPGAVCGMIRLSVHDTPDTPWMVRHRRARIDELMVAGWARRRGCGRLLLAHATRWARARGARQILLTVWAGNLAAEEFYRRLGYQVVSTVLGADL